MIDPARRGYDDGDARRAWPSCSGRRRAGRRRPRALAWARVGARRARRSPARRRSRSRFRAPTTSRSPRPSTSTRSRDGRVPLSFHFNGTVFYRGADGRLQVDAGAVELRPRSSAMPVAAWRAMIAEHYPGGGWIRLDARHARRAQRAPRRARPAELRRLRRGAARGGRRCSMSSSTRCCTRATRSTRTRRRDQERDADAVRDRLPAGLRRRVRRARYDHARLECVAQPRRRTLTARAALPGADRRAATRPRERRVELGPVAAGERGDGRAFDGGAASRCAPSRRRRRCSCGRACTTRREVPPGLDRGAGARALADLDPHRRRARRPGGSSRRSRAGARASTSGRCSRRPTDDAVLGAAIVLPDHPQIAPAEPRQPVRQHRDRGGAACCTSTR